MPTPPSESYDIESSFENQRVGEIRQTAKKVVGGGIFPIRARMPYPPTDCYDVESSEE
jgi:hypothetical protein